MFRAWVSRIAGKQVAAAAEREARAAWCKNCGDRASWRPGFCSQACVADWDHRYNDDPIEDE